MNNIIVESVGGCDYGHEPNYLFIYLLRKVNMKRLVMNCNEVAFEKGQVLKRQHKERTTVNQLILVLDFPKGSDVHQ